MSWIRESRDRDPSPQSLDDIYEKLEREIMEIRRPMADYKSGVTDGKQVQRKILEHERSLETPMDIAKKTADEDLERELMELRIIMEDYKASVIDKEEVAFRIREYNESLRQKEIE